MKTMPQRIHYQDDIFYLSLIARTTAEGFSVDVDPELFLQKLRDDILFVEQRLSAMFEMLSSNDRLLDRLEYLKLLEGVILPFSSGLEKLRSGALPLSCAVESAGLSLDACIDRLGELKKVLDEELRSGSGTRDLEMDVVSQDELSELLKE